MEAVDKTIPTPERVLDVPFLLPVDHVYQIPGRGCVIAGRLERGKLKAGQEVEIIGYNKISKGKVTGIEMFRKILAEANAGDRMGLLVKGVKQDDVRRGMCVVKPKSLKQHDSFKAQVSNNIMPNAYSQTFSYSVHPHSLPSEDTNNLHNNNKKFRNMCMETPPHANFKFLLLKCYQNGGKLT